MSSIHAQRVELLKNRAFLLYFIGTTVSYFGNGMQYIANSWLALEMADANYSVGIVLICSALPGILLSPFSGVFVDWMDRKYLAASMDFFRALVLLSIPLISWLGELNIWHIYLMAFLVAIGDLVFQPAVIALIREIIPKNLLLTANSTTQITAQIGSLIGAGLGGLIVAYFSPVWVMLLNAFTFIVSCLCILAMPKSDGMKSSERKSWSLLAKRFFTELETGIQYIKQNQQIFILYLIMLSYPITLRSINSLLPIFSKDVLKVGAEGFGYIDAAFAVGAIVGGFLLPSFVNKLGNSLALMVGLGALGASLLFFSISFDIWTGILGYFLIGCTFQSRILYLTTIQHQVDLEVQGRVHSVYTTFVSVFALVVYFLTGVLSEVVSARWLYALQGIIVLIATSYFCYLYTNKKLTESEAYAEKN
ncbi:MULTISPECIES: MFS transporter [Geobacillus]|uniref:MFS transporter n=1 Tax=Geobacillus TaxID=129337 RepID=UPI0005CCB5B3|nr:MULTISPECIES: MFS transporter [Geobacillus]TWG25018.1 Arabinose efflux permease [Geobacillus sp. C56-T2]